jgi:flavodoxin I
MKSIGIFYGSTTDNTKNVAVKLQEGFGVDFADVFDIATATPEMMADYKYLIFGTSTWGFGDLQDDWDSFLPELKKVDFTGKKVALFGLGNGESYSTSFVSGMGELYKAIADRAEVVGFVSKKGYYFDDSTAFVGDHFIGLPLDEDNEPRETNTRIDNWLTELRAIFI